MSLRAFGSLFTRRLSPRGIPRALAESTGIGIQKAPGSAAGRPSLSIPTLRDLAAGDGAYGTVVAAAGLAGFVGILFFSKKGADEPAAKVFGEEAMKEVAVKEPVREVPVKKVICDRQASQEVADRKSLKKQDMKARLEDWAQKYNKIYKDEEEKAMRFEVFKARAESIDSRSSSDQKKMHLETSYFADWTHEERLWQWLPCG